MKKEYKELNSYEKGMILALCLGDGCLNKPRGKCQSVQLEIGHSEKQKEYCIYKRDLLFNLLGGFGKLPKIQEKTIKLKKTGKEYKACRFVKTHDYFKHLRSMLYINGRKTITRDLLNMLSVEGLAIWYMDDGSCYYEHSEITGEPIHLDLRISTDCFTKEEHEIMVDYFREVWNIHFYVFYSKTRDVYCLRAHKEAALQFIDLIKPYVIESMQYKCLIESHECETSEKSDDDIV